MNAPRFVDIPDYLGRIAFDAYGPDEQVIRWDDIHLEGRERWRRAAVTVRYSNPGLDFGKIFYESYYEGVASRLDWDVLGEPATGWFTNAAEAVRRAEL